MPLPPRSAPGSRASGLDSPAKSALRSERFSRRDGIPAATSGQASPLLPALAQVRSDQVRLNQVRSDEVRPDEVRPASGSVESPRRLGRPALPPLLPPPNSPR